MRALRGLRVHVPLLLALSANSPFWQARDTGLASARVPVFGAFPRVGIPRAFGSYAEYVDVIDVLLRCRAIPEPTFLWWDVRLQPKLGTIEVRILDAQTRAEDNATLAALVQSVVRLEATEGHVAAAFEGASRGARRKPLPRDARRHAGGLHLPRGRPPPPGARDPRRSTCRLRATRRGAQLRGGACAITALADDPGYQRQRMLVGVRQGEPVGQPAIGMLVSALAADFTAGPRERVALV